MAATDDWRKWRGPEGRIRRVRAILRRLDAAYGPFVAKEPMDPLDGLILTVLSQATSDANSTRAFARLKERFPTWRSLLDGSPRALEEAIRPGGLARSKTKTIRTVLSRLDASPGGLDLAGLGASSDAEVIERLTSIPGVGLKTACCVLLFDLDRPVMPVDTHVARLSRRLGLVTERAAPDAIHHVLMAIVPEEHVHEMHVWLIAHGRARCRSQRPDCSSCELSQLCPSKE